MATSLDIQAVAASPDGQLPSWVRGNILLKTLRTLDKEGSAYAAILAHELNKDAMRYLESLHASLSARSSELDSTQVSESINALRADIRAFLDGSSFLLASVLLQAAGGERDLNATLRRLGLGRVEADNQIGCSEYTLLTVSVLATVAIAVWFALYYFQPTILGLIARFLDIEPENSSTVYG